MTRDAGTPVQSHTWPVAGAGEQPAAAIRERYLRRTFSSLRHRDFALLWAGTGVMSAGQWLQQVTLNWLMFEMTGSAFMLRLVNGVRMAPFILTSLASGVMADRHDRRRLMLVTQVYLAASALLMALLLLSGQAAPWHLIIFTFVSGLGWSFTGPVRQSLVPALVPREDVMNAIALMSAAFNLTRTLGPAAGGILLAWVGGGGNFLAQAVLYAAVAVLVASMRIPALPGTATEQRAGAWESMWEGIQYVRSNGTVLTLLLLALVPMTLGLASYQGLLPIFAAEVYHIGAGGLGVLMAVSGLGAFVASMRLAGAHDMARKGLVQLVALGALGVTLMVFGPTTWLPLGIVLLFAAGGAQMLYMALNQTLLQHAIPDEVRGRVTSLYMLNNGLVPAFAFGAGAVAQAIGAPATIAIMGALITLIATLAAWRLKAVRAL